jgi:hypothetical protein
MSIGAWRNGAHIECDWGVIEKARPHLGQVAPLVLVWAAGVHDLIKNGDNRLDAPAVASVTLVTDDDPPTEDSPIRMFYHLDYAGQRWTWELFDMHWTDAPEKTSKLYIGRWPD